MEREVKQDIKTDMKKRPFIQDLPLGRVRAMERSHGPSTIVLEHTVKLNSV